MYVCLSIKPDLDGTLLFAINDLSRKEKILNQYRDISKNISPKILNFIHPDKLQLFCENNIITTEEGFEFIEIPGTISEEFIDEESLYSEYYSNIQERLDPDCFDEVVYGKDANFRIQDNYEMIKQFNTWQKEAGLKPIFYRN